MNPVPVWQSYAEQLVLAGCLNQPTAIADTILARLRDQDMLADDHGQILAAIRQVRADQAPVDPVSVARVMWQRNKALAWAEWLTKLNALMLTPIANEQTVLYQMRLIEEQAILRDLTVVGQQITAMAMTSEDDAATTFTKAQSLFVQLADRMGSHTARMITLGESVAEVMEHMATAVTPGILTHYRDLDQFTGGLHREDLTIIGARPGNGKTLTGLNLAMNLSEHGVAVLFASVEMGHGQLTQRLIARASRLDSQRIRNHTLSIAEAPRLRSAAGQLTPLPITILDDPMLTIDSLRANVRVWARSVGSDTPKVVIVDYLQLMRGTARRRQENRVLELGEISSGLKQQIARELTLPVIALAQLSRAVESRSSHIPMLSDLRESGNLEQDADNVWFLYREELYDPNTDKKGIMEVHIAKHRNGPVGVIPMRLDPITQTLSTLTYREIDL